MKNCKAYEALLDAFAEGDLFTEDMLQVQQHLNECPHCQAYVDDLLAIRAAFPSLEDEEVPEGFADSVMAAVAAHPQAAAAPAAAPKKQPTRWLRIAAPLAACCAIVILLQNGPFGDRNTVKQKAASESTVSYAITTADTATPAAAPAATTEEAPAAMMDAPAAAALPESAAEVVEAPQAEARIVVNDTHHYTAGGETGASAPYRIRITVDTDYIGNALDDHAPVVVELPEGRTELHYELTMVQYEALLSALSDREELPAEEVFDTESETVLVIVRK